MTDSSRRPAASRLLLFYGITILFFLAFAELVLGLMDPEQIMVREDDPRMVYSFYPERRGIAAGPEYRVEVRTDARGLRACRTSEPEPATGNGSRTVYVFGDSFAEGWGVGCEKTFAGLLDASPNLRVLNGGLHGGSPGYYILRHRVLREPGRQGGDETVIVQLFDNDLDDLDTFEPFLVRDEQNPEKVLAGRPAALAGMIPAGRFSRFIKNRALYRAIKRIYYGVRGTPLPIKYYRPGRAPQADPLAHAEALKQFGGLEPLSDLEQAYNGQFAFYKYQDLESARGDELWGPRLERMEQHLDQLVREIEGEGETSPAGNATRVVFAYIPAKEVFAPGGISGSGPDRTLTVNELRSRNPFYQLLADFARTEQVRLVDGQAVLHENAEDLYYPGDAHLNARGHARLAAALAKAVQR